MTLLITYLLLAIFLAAMCSILEATLLSSTSSYIENLENSGYSKKTANMVKNVKNNIDKSIASILTVNTFATTMCAAGVRSQATIVFGLEWQTFVAFALTILLLYFAEIFPKTMAAIYWRGFLIQSAYIITFLIKLTYPLVYIGSFITNYLQKNRKNGEEFSKDEIIAMVNLGEKEGTVHSNESSLISNLFKLQNIKTEEIMTPRSVVFALNENTTVEEAIEDDNTYTFSRIPVYKDSIDNIVGVVLSQTILEEGVEDKDSTLISSIMTKAKRVDRTLPVSSLLDKFISEKTHLFIVEDKYGQTSGVVTLEDAIETLLGVEIVDEKDEHEDMQEVAKNRVFELEKL